MANRKKMQNTAKSIGSPAPRWPTIDDVIWRLVENAELFWFTISAGFGAEGVRKGDTDEKIKAMIPEAIRIVKMQLGK